MTCGDTIEEAVEMAMDAKKCWLEDAIEMGKKYLCRNKKEI